MPGLGSTMSSPSYEELEEEVKFLRFYMERAYDIFGPADADVDHMIKAEYENRGNVLPEKYKEEE